MIGIISKTPLFQKTLADALAQFNVQCADTLQKNWQVAVVFLSQEQTNLLFKSDIPYPIILIGSHHEKAFGILNKPCRLKELKILVIDALHASLKTLIFENKNFFFSSATRQIKNKKNGQFIELSEKETDLIAYLAQNKGKTISKELLLKEVWNYHQDAQTHTIETHIYKLRQKLGEDAAAFIQNTSEGYSLVL